MIAYLSGINFDATDFVFIPIPLHPKRQRERGFNQAELLARDIAVAYPVPVLTNLIRSKLTKPQAEIHDRQLRIENMNNAFTLADPSVVQGKNIALVDDVFTSGATMNAAVSVLKAAGAKKIIAITVAKA